MAEPHTRRDGRWMSARDPFAELCNRELEQAFSQPAFRPPRAPRKPTLAAALKEADRAGEPVKGAAIYPDRVELRFGEAAAVSNNNKDNDVEAWINKHAHKTAS
jgi:hypothetical protein